MYNPVVTDNTLQKTADHYLLQIWDVVFPEVSKVTRDNFQINRGWQWACDASGVTVDGKVSILPHLPSLLSFSSSFSPHRDVAAGLQHHSPSCSILSLVHAGLKCDCSLRCYPPSSVLYSSSLPYGHWPVIISFSRFSGPDLTRWPEKLRKLCTHLPSDRFIPPSHKKDLDVNV
jgi:hypothetical protein